MRAARVVESLIGIVLAFIVGAAYAAGPAVSLTHLTGPLYLVRDAEYAKTNSLVYVGAETVTVIGATWSPESASVLAGEIRKVTDKPVTEVINNDYNPEYAGGNRYWERIGATIISTRRTRKLLESDWVKVGNLVRKYFPDYPHVPLALPTKVYPGSFRLQGGNIEALYLGPSHTPDDIFVYFPREKVLYAGSILKEHLGNMVFADVDQYIETLHKLQALHLDIRIIISGHWSAVHGPELIEQYLSMLKRRTSKR